MDDMFVNEDISKPENRVNLALFHLQMNDDFHKWFCEQLGISDSCVIYPQKGREGIRPDFIVKDCEKELGCIEVELRDENEEQLKKYRMIYETVFSITGKKTHKSNLGLNEVANFLSDEKNISTANSQTKLSAHYLVNLIQSYAQDKKYYSRNSISEQTRNNPLIKSLLDALVDYEPRDGQSKAEPGKYYCDTYEAKGFSFRVYSPISKISKSVSLFSMTNGRDFISFSSAEKYHQYLTHKPNNDVKAWIGFITNELGLPIDKIKLKSRLEISISSLSVNFENFINNIKPLI
jgi:hypothetical protein